MTASCCVSALVSHADTSVPVYDCLTSSCMLVTSDFASLTQLGSRTLQWEPPNIYATHCGLNVAEHHMQQHFRSRCSTCDQLVASQSQMLCSTAALVNIHLITNDQLSLACMPPDLHNITDIEQAGIYVTACRLCTECFCRHTTALQKNNTHTHTHDH